MLRFSRNVTITSGYNSRCRHTLSNFHGQIRPGKHTDVDMKDRVYFISNNLRHTFIGIFFQPFGSAYYQLPGRQVFFKQMYIGAHGLRWDGHNNGIRCFSSVF
jgi:hypothetical protein